VTALVLMLALLLLLRLRLTGLTALALLLPGLPRLPALGVLTAPAIFPPAAAALLLAGGRARLAWLPGLARLARISRDGGRGHRQAFRSKLFVVTQLPMLEAVAGAHDA
jgi:hypothetical protein